MHSSKERGCWVSLHARLCFNTHPAARCPCVVTRPRPLGCWGTHTDTALPAERCRCVNKAVTCQAQGPGPSPMKSSPSHDPDRPAGHRGREGGSDAFLPDPQKIRAETQVLAILRWSQDRTSLSFFFFFFGHLRRLVGS